jgi:hypothetical protein
MAAGLGQRLHRLLQNGGAALVAHHAGLHSVHDVGDGDVLVLIDHNQGAPVPAPVAGPWADGHGLATQAVAHAEASG